MVTKKKRAPISVTATPAHFGRRKTFSFRAGRSERADGRAGRADGRTDGAGGADGRRMDSQPDGKRTHLCIACNRADGRGGGRAERTDGRAGGGSGRTDGRTGRTDGADG